MRKIVFALVSVLFANINFAQEIKHYAENQLIVKVNADANCDLEHVIQKQRFGNSRFDLLNETYQVKNIRRTGNKKKKDTYILTFKNKQAIDQLIKQYQNTGLFEYVEPNFIGSGAGQKAEFQILPNDPFFSRQYGLYNDGSFSFPPVEADADIDMELAWDIEQGDASIIVAVLDAGAKLNHPEFAGRIWDNDLESLNGSDDDNNGYTDDLQGWDFVNNDNNATDDHGHGTNVAGIIGANGNNNIGYAGVDWNCKLMICKVLDQNNNGFYSYWIDAIFYAVDNGANVINMSLGGLGNSIALEQAVNYAYNNGVTVVTSMMDKDNNVTYYPAGFQNSIAVGATDASDERASPFFWSSTSGSNYGSHIDVVAPGDYIYGLNHLSNVNFDTYWGGTSQSAPLVTGLTSLLLAQDPFRSPDEIRAIIRNTAEDQVGTILEDGLGFDQYYGYGRVNAHQALLQGAVSVDDIAASKVSIFPNPSSDYLFIKSKIDYKEIRLINMLGSTFFRSEIQRHSDLQKIDISDLPSGIYLIKISNNDKTVIVSKKIVKH